MYGRKNTIRKIKVRNRKIISNVNQRLRADATNKRADTQELFKPREKRPEVREKDKQNTIKKNRNTKPALQASENIFSFTPN